MISQLARFRDILNISPPDFTLDNRSLFQILMANYTLAEAKSQMDIHLIINSVCCSYSPAQRNLKF